MTETIPPECPHRLTCSKVIGMLIFQNVFRNDLTVRGFLYKEIIDEINANLDESENCQNNYEFCALNSIGFERLIQGAEEFTPKGKDEDSDLGSVR